MGFFFIINHHDILDIFTECYVQYVRGYFLTTNSAAPIRKVLWRINPRATPLKLRVHFLCLLSIQKTHAHIFSYVHIISVTSATLCHSSCDIHIIHVNTDTMSLLHDVILAADTHTQQSYITSMLAAVTATQQSNLVTRTHTHMNTHTCLQKVDFLKNFRTKLILIVPPVKCIAQGVTFKRQKKVSLQDSFKMQSTTQRY